MDFGAGGQLGGTRVRAVGAGEEEAEERDSRAAETQFMSVNGLRSSGLSIGSRYSVRQCCTVEKVNRQTALS